MRELCCFQAFWGTNSIWFFLGAGVGREELDRSPTVDRGMGDAKSLRPCSVFESIYCSPRILSLLIPEAALFHFRHIPVGDRLYTSWGKGQWSVPKRNAIPIEDVLGVPIRTSGIHICNFFSDPPGTTTLHCGGRAPIPETFCSPNSEKFGAADFDWYYFGLAKSSKVEVVEISIAGIIVATITY